LLLKGASLRATDENGNDAFALAAEEDLKQAMTICKKEGASSAHFHSIVEQAKTKHKADKEEREEEANQICFAPRPEFDPCTWTLPPGGGDSESQ
jgi:hypothetical protein